MAGAACRQVLPSERLQKEAACIEGLYSSCLDTASPMRAPCCVQLMAFLGSWAVPLEVSGSSELSEQQRCHPQSTDTPCAEPSAPRKEDYSIFYCPRTIPGDPCMRAQVAEAWGLLLRAAPALRQEDGFRYDLVDVSRQVGSLSRLSGWRPPVCTPCLGPAARCHGPPPGVLSGTGACAALGQCPSSQ